MVFEKRVVMTCPCKVTLFISSNSKWKPFSYQSQCNCTCISWILHFFGSKFTQKVVQSLHKPTTTCMCTLLGQGSLTTETFSYKIIRAWHFGLKDQVVFDCRDRKYRRLGNFRRAQIFVDHLQRRKLNQTKYFVWRINRLNLFPTCTGHYRKC